VYFQTKNPDLGKFWRALEWKGWYMYSVAIWYILCQIGNFVSVCTIYSSPPVLVYCVKKNLATLSVCRKNAAKEIRHYSACLTRCEEYAFRKKSFHSAGLFQGVDLMKRFRPKFTDKTIAGLWILANTWKFLNTCKILQIVNTCKQLQVCKKRI
jgi:hypothetical protein